MKRTWISEFGESYTVPAEVLAAVASGELVDISWHNDPQRQRPVFVLGQATPNRSFLEETPMKNAFELTLKPEETQVLLKKDFQTVEELQALLDEAVSITNQHPSTIYVEIPVSLGDFDTRPPRTTQGTEFVLQAEGLTDGSVVYNITLE